MKRTARSGFTLVEMLVVIVVISILVALVVPAVSRAMTRAREAAVMAEINGLSTAIVTFKSKYGSEPPSQITIVLPNGATPPSWTNYASSMATIRGLWPQFDFTMGAGAGTTYPTYWNSIAQTDAAGNKVLNFNSGECLLFFLGGVMKDTASGPNVIPTGFAKNPKWPFSPDNIISNREGPFFEFTAKNRVMDFDGNGINEWYDSLPGQTKPYLYFSSYDGQGYRIAELPQSAGQFLFVHDVYRISPNSGQQIAPQNPSAIPTGSQTLQPQKGQSFQIISPGYDGDFGWGGVFDSNLQNSGLIALDLTKNPPVPIADFAAFDNLTNFNPGRLNP